MNRWFLLLAVGFLASPGVGWGDVVTLKDGTRIEGEIRRGGDGYVVTEAGGKVTTVAFDRISKIDVRPLSGGDAATARLQSLRRATENLSDIHQILDRYRAFIDQNPNTPAAVEAQNDIKIWTDRQSRGLVKVGDQWITPGERDALRAKNAQVALRLHDMIKQGRLKEATPLLDKSLSIDPQNISLLYLRGVLLYQQDLIPTARKAFEAVLPAAPDHAPTLNNLGVILWRQNARVPALGYYDRALLAATGSPEILNNIAEALNALPKEQRELAITKKLVRDFKEQDDAMQKQMADRGLYRWGSSWVDEKEYAKLQAQEKVARDKLNQMQLDFETIQRRVATIDRRIADINSQMAVIDQQSVMQDASGRMMRLPYPQQYYTLAREAGSLKSERGDRVADLDRMRLAANQVKQQLPQPKYTGIQKIIDADGMPVQNAGEATPATQPAATQPIAARAPATQPTATRPLVETTGN